MSIKVESVSLDQQSSNPSSPDDGRVWYVTGTGFRFQEEGVVKSLAGSGITSAQHAVLNQLIHFIDEGPAEGFVSGATKTVAGGAFPTQVLWRRADSTKLVEQLVTWTGVLPTTVQWKVYDTNGTTVLATVTDSITYSGPFETGRSRSIA